MGTSSYMSNFDGRQFAAGSIKGLRAFDVTEDGVLVGPSYPQAFKQGENVAVCMLLVNTPALSVLRALSIGGRPKPLENLPDCQWGHRAAEQDCTCGYYAFFDGGNDYARSNRVTAVIEGYGLCTVGSRGFRCEKARLVAMVNPCLLDRRKYPMDLFFMIAGFAWVGLAAMEFLKGKSAHGALDVFIALMYMVIPTLSYLLNRKLSMRKVAWKQVRAQYPDVPVYKNQKAMLKDHPLYKPSEDDF